VSEIKPSEDLVTNATQISRGGAVRPGGENLAKEADFGSAMGDNLEREVIYARTEGDMRSREGRGMRRYHLHSQGGVVFGGDGGGFASP
jgi:hypothetical protein